MWIKVRGVTHHLHIIVHVCWGVHANRMSGRGVHMNGLSRQRIPPWGRPANVVKGLWLVHHWFYPCCGCLVHISSSATLHKLSLIRRLLLRCACSPWMLWGKDPSSGRSLEVSPAGELLPHTLCAVAGPGDIVVEQANVLLVRACGCCCCWCCCCSWSTSYFRVGASLGWI